MRGQCAECHERQRGAPESEGRPHMCTLHCTCGTSDVFTRQLRLTNNYVGLRDTKIQEVDEILVLTARYVRVTACVRLGAQ